MILEKLKVLDIRKVGNIDEGIEAGITNESLPFVFELVSSRLYSNPIGSIVREITSNCFDSHIEAGIDNPVIINKSYSIEEGYSIEFKDVGIGMSPERINNIYMNYFSSSKRDSNDQIGAFGLGSKTPLSYTDMFYITTIYDKVEYQYIFHKGSNKPTLESLLGYDETEEKEEIWTSYNEDLDEYEELVKPIIKTRITKIPIGIPTEEHNGTTIKINMETKDVPSFISELKFQLAYFDNVYFTNWSINNEYNIYEGKYFKFRSDIDQINGNIHICIGKVRYRLDESKIDIPHNFRSIPIAVKFEIGELQITPSRESLRYEDRDIKLIEERIKLAIAEIVAIFESQNPEVEDFYEFNKLMKDTPKITFNKEKNHGIYIWDNSGISKNYKFKPFSNLPFKKTPKNFFFMWETIGYLDYSGFHSRLDNVTNQFIVDKNILVIRREERTSDYTNLYIKENLDSTQYIIRRKILDFEEAVQTLGIKKVGKRLGDKVLIEEKDKKDKLVVISKAKILAEFIKITNGIIYKKAKLYNDCRPTDKWINDYKKSIKESSLAWIRKKNRKVFVRDAACAFKGVERLQLELENRTGILVYGFKEDQEVLRQIYNTVINSWKSIRKINTIKKQEKAFMVLQVSKSNEDLILGAEKTMYWRDFLEGRFFKELYYYYLKNKAFSSIYLSSNQHKLNLIKGLEEEYDRIRDSILLKFRDGEFYISDKYIPDNLIKNRFDSITLFEAKYCYNIPLLDNIDNSIYNNEQNKKIFFTYLKSIGVRLKNKYYLKTNGQLAKEQRHKEFISTTLILIKSFKESYKNNLLTYNLNLTNVNNQENNNENCKESSTQEGNITENIIEEDRAESDSIYRQEELF